MKPKLLIVTGIDAYQELIVLDWTSVRDRYELVFHQSNCVIAAFMTKNDIEEALQQYNSTDFALVLVSGLIPWDVSQIQGDFSRIIKKGPRNLANLPEVLTNLPISDFSPISPTDSFQNEKIWDKVQEIIHSFKQQFQQSPDPGGFTLSGKFSHVIFHRRLPPVVIAEVIDFPSKSFEELCRIIDIFCKNGVEIVDLGCIANSDNCNQIATIIPRLKHQFPTIPFGIDTANTDEIHTAVEAGIDLILSLSPENFERCIDLPKFIPIVLIPGRDYLSSTQSLLNVQIRVDLVWQLYLKMEALGFQKLLLDPILSIPINPGILPSLTAYFLLSERIEQLITSRSLQKKTFQGKFPQIFMGFGNITELVDADSPGLTAFLSLIAMEIHASGILTTEVSKKTRNSLHELQQIREWAFYAEHLHAPPINLGITGLIFKSKTGFPQYTSRGEPTVIVLPIESEAQMDPHGFFKIYIEERLHQIIISHFSNDRSIQSPTHTFMGTTAESVYKAIIAAGLILRLDHAAYLGKELVRAEIALKYGSPYIQE